MITITVCWVVGVGWVWSCMSFVYDTESRVLEIALNQFHVDFSKKKKKLSIDKG